ncbi:hypothetical protein [Dyadobacter sp. CY312]|uniref:hypothetical protein n=1 Tax=Dyadobacter sp. CY312 TaxID=2907303 RepID=UPI001F1BD06B|nr:hypothetical protein [Dyadobacter sp. CY312]MCE7039201.1 hypothetical protein [Dyadobacter sp. CY312]
MAKRPSSTSNYAFDLEFLNEELITYFQQHRKSESPDSLLYKGFNMSILFYSTTMVEGALWRFLKFLINHYSGRQDLNTERNMVIQEFNSINAPKDIIKTRIKQIQRFSGLDLSNDMTNPYYKDIIVLPAIRNVIAHGGVIALSQIEKNPGFFKFQKTDLLEVLMRSDSIPEKVLHRIGEGDLPTITGAFLGDKNVDYFSERSISFKKLLEQEKVTMTS